MTGRDNPPTPPPRTRGQRKTDILIGRIYDELSREFPDLESKPELRLVNKDPPFELWLAIFADRDPLTKDRLLKALMWSGKEFDTYDYFNQGLREYTKVLKDRRNRALAEFLTAPLTIPDSATHNRGIHRYTTRHSDSHPTFLGSRRYRHQAGPRPIMVNTHGRHRFLFWTRQRGEERQEPASRRR